MMRFNVNSLTPELAAMALADQKRSDKAAGIPRSDMIALKDALGMFLVKSQSGHGYYYVKAPLQKGEPWTCTCMDYTHRVKECKHVKAVRSLLEESE